VSLKKRCANTADMALSGPAFMHRRSVLIVTYHYLPAETPGSRRLEAVARLLHARGWEVIVLTATPTRPGAADTPGIEVIRTTRAPLAADGRGHPAIATPAVSRIPLVRNLAWAPVLHQSNVIRTRLADNTIYAINSSRVRPSVTHRKTRSTQEAERWSAAARAPARALRSHRSGCEAARMAVWRRSARARSESLVALFVAEAPWRNFTIHDLCKTADNFYLADWSRHTRRVAL
jgi:hypothetical protein